MVWLAGPSLVGRHQGDIGRVGRRTKVPGINTPHWKPICCEFSDVFENPGILPRRATKHKIDLLPESVPPAELVQNSTCRTCWGQ